MRMLLIAAIAVLVLVGCEQGLMEGNETANDSADTTGNVVAPNAPTGDATTGNTDSGITNQQTNMTNDLDFPTVVDNPPSNPVYEDGYRRLD